MVATMTKGGRPPGPQGPLGFKRGDQAGRLHAHVRHSESIAEGVKTACWLWVGRVDRAGYAQVKIGNRSPMAHRWAYELLVGPIPDGLTLDHLCRQPSCVNPDHLEPVSQRANNLRAPTSLTTINATKTHCPAGIHTTRRTPTTCRMAAETARSAFWSALAEGMSVDALNDQEQQHESDPRHLAVPP